MRRNKINPWRARRRGYTLVEVLVALIATSLFLTTVLPATLASLRRLEFSSKKDRALWLAIARIEALSARPDVPIGTTGGKTGDLSWEVIVTDAAKVTGAPAGVSLRELKVRVTEDQDTLAVVTAQRIYPVR